MAFVLKALKWIGKIFLGIGGLVFWALFILTTMKVIDVEPADAKIVWKGVFKKKKQ